jgi:allantoinase
MTDGCSTPLASVDEWERPDAVDLIVHGGNVVTPQGVVNADVLVSGELISGIAPPGAVASGRRLDATGCWVWPGVVDTHVHIGDPGYAERERFEGGTRSAIAGGVTTIVEMPINRPLPTTAELVEDKRRHVAPQALCDYGLWAALVPGSSQQLAALADVGVRLVKGFMHDYRVTVIDRIDDWELACALEAGRDHGVVIAVHAENHDILTGASRAAEPSAQCYGEERPLLAELEATARAALLARETGGMLHVVHASAGSVVAEVARARAAGAAVTVETCPPYLLFNAQDGRRMGSWLKCAPPLRERPEQLRLWQHLEAGEVDLVVSDHAPATISAKAAPLWQDVPNGIQSLQTTLPAMIDAWVTDRNLPPEMLARLCSENPARLAGLEDRKGAIKVGAHADLVIVDMHDPWELQADDLHYQHRWSPWIGHRFEARVRRVLLRGRDAVVDGQVCIEPGTGRYCAGHSPLGPLPVVPSRAGSTPPARGMRP